MPGWTYAQIQVMGTRIIEFGGLQSDILAALAGNGYEIDACGASILNLKRALQRPDLGAIALAENGASKAVTILAPAPSDGMVPLILFQDESGTGDRSQFDLVIPAHTPLPNLLQRVAALIERSRVLQAETRMSGERFHSLLRQATSLLEQSVTAGAEFQRIRGARLRGSVAERVSIPCILVVDDYTRWRETVCSMLNDCVDCRWLCEAGDGIEAVQRATELKPQLILLDLDLPRLNGIEAARQIMKLSPKSAILFVSMNNCEDVVSEALSTGARGYLLKADAASELWPAIEAVLGSKQYLSRGLRGRHSATIN